jgi:hypothetical protein
MNVHKWPSRKLVGDSIECPHDASSSVGFLAQAKSREIGNQDQVTPKVTFF